MARDLYYRSFCYEPKHYDRVIGWIAKNNPAAKEPQIYIHYGNCLDDFASEVVNSCIRVVIFGRAEQMYASLGMAMATRASINRDSPDYKKVILSIQLLSDSWDDIAP